MKLIMKEHTMRKTRRITYLIRNKGEVHYG